MRDVVIIGGGIAGLTAAVYLGRFRRPAVVLDAGASRARWIPQSHNTPGFPHGVGGAELLSRLKSQAESFGAEIQAGRANSIRREGEGFTIELGTATIRSRFLLLATGIQDHLPAVAGAEEALLRSVLRVCPICDGFEAINKRIAVIGDGARGEREAHFLRTFSEQVCYVHVAGEGDSLRRQRLKDRGIELVEANLDQFRIREHALQLILPGAVARTFDVVYGALGCTPQIDLAASLGALCDENNALRVNGHQQTSVDRLYAAGDLVKGLNQIVVAAAEAAIASTDIHNRLRAGC